MQSLPAIELQIDMAGMRPASLLDLNVARILQIR
jgi:hypothetical protein